MKTHLGGHHPFAAFPQETADELYEGAPCGYLTVDPGGLIVRANGKFAEWLGISREELIGEMHLIELLSPAGKSFYQAHFDDVMGAQGEGSGIRPGVAGEGRQYRSFVDQRHPGTECGRRTDSEAYPDRQHCRSTVL